MQTSLSSSMKTFKLPQQIIQKQRLAWQQNLGKHGGKFDSMKRNARWEVRVQVA